MTEVRVEEEILIESGIGEEDCQDPHAKIYPGDVNISNRIFVKGFNNRETTEEDLTDFFEIYGEVRSANIVRDKMGMSKGYAFVTFYNQSVAEKVQNEGRVPYKDRELIIGPAILRPKRNPKAFGNTSIYYYTPNGFDFYACRVDNSLVSYPVQQQDTNGQPAGIALIPAAAAQQQTTDELQIYEEEPDEQEVCFVEQEEAPASQNNIQEEPPQEQQVAAIPQEAQYFIEDPPQQQQDHIQYYQPKPMYIIKQQPQVYSQQQPVYIQQYAPQMVQMVPQQKIAYVTVPMTSGVEGLAQQMGTVTINNHEYLRCKPVPEQQWKSSAYLTN